MLTVIGSANGLHAMRLAGKDITFIESKVIFVCVLYNIIQTVEHNRVLWFRGRGLGLWPSILLTLGF